MEKTKSFRDLIVWQKAMDLVVTVYEITETFPQSEMYGLTSQIRRAVIAIPSNIAEGYLRRHTKEYAQFINVAYASGAELETQLEISFRLHYISQSKYQEILEKIVEVMKMLNKLERVLRTNS